MLQEDKDALNELCLISFVQAFKSSRPTMTFLFDHCSPKMYDMVERVVPFDYTIRSSSIGINETMLLSYAIAAKTQGAVLFQECDYLYKPQQVGELLEKAIYELGFVSPYDHPNFYRTPDLHKDEATLKLIDGQHFRSTERNTMTWGTTAELVRENREILDKYGYLDGDVWYELKDKGHQLFVPIPSLATHMVSDCLAPGVDWEKIWKKP